MFKKSIKFLFVYLVTFLSTQSVYQNTDGNRLISKAEIKISGQVVDLRGLTTTKEEEELKVELEKDTRGIEPIHKMVLVFNHPEVDLTYDNNELVNLNIEKITDKTTFESFKLKISSSALSYKALGELKSQSNLVTESNQGEERLKLIKMTAIYK